MAAARTALAAATQALASDPRTDEFFDLQAGPFGFNDIRRTHLAAGVHLRIGENSAAVQAARESLALRLETPIAQRSFGSEAVARVTIATGLAAQGHLDGSKDALREVLDITEPMRVAPVAKRLSGLRTLIARKYPDDRAASDLSEQIEEFVRASPTRMLPSPRGDA